MNFSHWKKLILVLFVSFFGISSTANAAQLVLPISSATPGTINASVTQGNIHSTICVSGFSKTIRPPASYTTNLKRQQLASTYSKYGSLDTSLFEEDHLIPLELGGNPTDPKNLWPEPWSGGTGARTKDKLENALHALICSGSLPLKTAQNAIATNWYAAYQQYVLKSTSTSSALAAAQELARKVADEIAKTKAGMLPGPTSTPVNQASTFSMPMFYQTIGNVRSNWGITGFANPPIVIQEAPPTSSFICKAPVDSDIILKQDPVYNTPVTTSTQVTLTLLCHLQLITAPTTSPAAVPAPVVSTLPTPVVPTPLYTPPSPTYSAPVSTPPLPSQPSGATGKCNDGSYSYAASHRGMCSGHGGVAQFYS
jgi:hypothetical protein